MLPSCFLAVNNGIYLDHALNLSMIICGVLLVVSECGGGLGDPDIIPWVAGHALGVPIHFIQTQSPGFGFACVIVFCFFLASG